MENGGSMLNRGRGQNGEISNLAWDNNWELNHSRFDWANNNATYSNTPFTISNVAGGGETPAETTRISSNGLAHNNYQQQQQQHSLYAKDVSHLHPDSHLMCLKLGKRHYLKDSSNVTTVNDRQPVGRFSVGKRGKSYSNVGRDYVGPSPSASAVSTAAVPRCQVEGCNVALVNVKDYHKRHKVCELHSKAPKVIVLGLEQRFCQQCSRFHVVSEFDDSKRSCRRRLAGHNQRRRKSSQDSISRYSGQDKLIVAAGRFPYLSSRGCALSLLSSTASDSLFSPSDISSRSSAALRELIAEHRATILARQLVLEQRLTCHQSNYMEQLSESQQQLVADPEPEPHNWGARFHEQTEHGHVTLDLMQATSSVFGLVSGRGKNKEEEQEECSELWKYNVTWKDH